MKLYIRGSLQVLFDFAKQVDLIAEINKMV